MLHCAALRENSSIFRDIACPNLEKHRILRKLDILCQLIVPRSILSLAVLFAVIRPSACNIRVWNKPHIEGEVGVVNPVAVLVKRSKLGKSNRLGRIGHVQKFGLNCVDRALISEKANSASEVASKEVPAVSWIKAHISEVID